MADDAVLGLRGKRAVVLGGGRGMGESAARYLADAGCDVAIIDLDADKADGVAAKVRMTGQQALAIAADVLDDSALTSALHQADAELGGIDVLVTVVGLAGWSPLLDMTDDHWDLDHRRNLRYVWVAAKTVARSMIDRGEGGSIVCIASVSGIQSAPLHAAYGAAKAGLMSLVRTMAVEWSEHGVRANAVAPGGIVTPRIPELPGGLEAELTEPLPMKRRGTVDEIGKAVLFFASDLSSYVTGQTLAVDGGWTSVFLMDPRKQLDHTPAGAEGMGADT